MTERVNIPIDLQVKKALTDIKKLQKDVKGLGTAGKKSTDKINKGLDKTAQKTKKVNKGTSSGVSAFNKLGTAIIAAYGVNQIKKFIAFLGSTIDATKQQEAAERSLTTALGKNSFALRQQASALQGKTAFGDEAIIQGQAYLAQLGLEEDQIKKLTPVVLDFAAAKGMDLATAADLVAKSVGSETNALSRYGIQIEGAKGSTERMQSAVNSLNKAYGGQAEAIALVDGGLQQLQNAIGDTKENMGELIAMMIGELIPGLTESLSEINSFASLGFEIKKQYGLTFGEAEKLAFMVNDLSLVFDKAGVNAFEYAKKIDVQRKALEDWLDENEVAADKKEYFKKVYADYFESVEDTTEAIESNTKATKKNNKSKEEAAKRQQEYRDNLEKSYKEEQEYQELFSDYENIFKRVTQARKDYSDLLDPEEEELFDFDTDLFLEKLETATKAYNDKVREMANIGTEFGSIIGQGVSDAIAGEEGAIKETLKKILISTLKMKKEAWQATALGEALITPDSVATGGATGLIKAALISGLIEAGYQTAVGVINTFEKGGHGVLQGKSHINGGINIPGVGNAQGGEYFGVINKPMTSKYKSILPDIFNSINKGDFEHRFNLDDSRLNTTNGYLKRMAERENVQQTKDFMIIKKGSITKKIRLN